MQELFTVWNFELYVQSIEASSSNVYQAHKIYLNNYFEWLNYISSYFALISCYAMKILIFLNKVPKPTHHNHVSAKARVKYEFKAKRIQHSSSFAVG